MSDDIEIMCRLERAIIAFSSDNFSDDISWEDMREEYIAKQTSVDLERK